MKHLILVIFYWLLGITASAQFFEGKVTSTLVYTSRTAGVTSAQFTSLMGDTQEYYIKGSHYKSVFNGKLMQWAIYVPSELKLYSKMANSETLLWNDVTQQADEVLTAELNKGKETILGYLCDELILTCKSGVQKYYFHSALGIDPNLYTKHAYGNWFEYLSRAKALPLKSIIETPQFVLESVATSLTPMKLDDAIFLLPPGAKTMKSPF